MPRAPSELDVVEHHLQQAARLIRDSNFSDLEVERLRGRIYDHIFQAIEICVDYAYSQEGSGKKAARIGLPLTSPSGRGGEEGRTDLRQDLEDLFK